jgi:hypothetical protein
MAVTFSDVNTYCSESHYTSLSRCPVSESYVLPPNPFSLCQERTDSWPLAYPVTNASTEPDHASQTQPIRQSQEIALDLTIPLLSFSCAHNHCPPACLLVISSNCVISNPSQVGFLPGVIILPTSLSHNPPSLTITTLDYSRCAHTHGPSHTSSSLRST